MRIAQLEIKNFRGIKEAKIDLPAHGVLFGPNNVGKTTITEGLALLLGREQMAPTLSDWDFLGGAPKPDSRIHIIATITDFASADAEPKDFPEWFLGDRSARTVWWNEQAKNVSYEADCPVGSTLAAQLALCIRYEEENCEFESIRYFYDGPCDPFTDDHRAIPTARFQELGVFILPSNRQWDKLLSFGSSSFLKVLKASDAIPGTSIEALKAELRDPHTKVETHGNLGKLLQLAEKELRSFLMLPDTGNLIYRPTSLDSRAVLQSLMPHIVRDNFLLPFSRSGSGMNSLQAFLVVLAFAEHRKSKGKNFILIAEEPELHLHPSLHRRLANRIRSMSTQSVTTTHSPLLASSYKPTEAIFIQNKDGTVSATKLRDGPISAIPTNAIRKLFLRKREVVYEALMGGAIVIPEGESDQRWLSLWQQIAETAEDVPAKQSLGPLTVIPTQDGQVTLTYSELQRFRPDALPLVDGDSTGAQYLSALKALTNPPKRIVSIGKNASIETVAAWVCEPCLSNPGPILSNLLPEVKDRHVKALMKGLSANKSDRELQENLAWECADCADSVARAVELIVDIRNIAAGGNPANPGWSSSEDKGVTVYVADHIQNV